MFSKIHGPWIHVDVFYRLKVLTNEPKFWRNAISIYKVEEYTEENSSVKRGVNQRCFRIAGCSFNGH